ncbi:uncharacterized protein LOC105210802 isoform X4 [Zeugodacus cucurbitae]|uniref:uncharacterized protein LOC105210802 isoform X4 n=1 Tax=Zeugodacus cucurbitae TaxID=28588 RepID=UPI0023D9004A|nr:uncharacterized protein LOC105210802 isoform X4 [Zeugodacus cucurbitae]
MELPSMVQRSGDTLIVRSVVSGNQLYLDQGAASTNNNQNNKHSSPSPLQQQQQQQSISAANLSNSTLEQFERYRAAAAQYHLQQQQLQNATQQQQNAVAAASAVAQQQAMELKDEGLPQCKIKRNYSCSYCTYFTQNPRYHLTHLRDVHGEKIVINKCKLCLYASRHFQKLVRHMKMVHGCTDGVTGGHGQPRGKRGMSREARKRKLEQSVGLGSAPMEINSGSNMGMSEGMPTYEQVKRELAVVYERELQAQRERELEVRQQARNAYEQEMQAASAAATTEAQRRQSPINSINNNNNNANVITNGSSNSVMNSQNDFQLPPAHQQPININTHSIELSSSPTDSVSSGQGTDAATSAALHSGGVSLSYVGDEPSQNRLLKCSLCDFTTLFRAQLLDHEMDEHCKTKFFRCEKCSYVTHIKARFSKHVKYHSMPMIKCVTCDFRTPYKWNLDRHMKNHGGAGPFKCAACDFTADIKQSLTVHEMNHHVPPVGHAAGMSLARRRNKVGGTDLCDDFLSDSVDLIEDHYNNNNIDEYEEALMTVEPYSKRSKYDDDEPTDLSAKGGSSDTSSVHNQSVSLAQTPKAKRPIPNLIPIPKNTGSSIINLSKEFATPRSSLTDIASMFLNDKHISEIFEKTDAAQLSPTPTVASTSSHASRSLLQKKPIPGGSFFDKLKSSALTGPNENLICPCGHMAKCLSESIIHRKTCNFAAIAEDDIEEEQDDADDRLEIDFNDDDDRQSHSALNLSVTGSTRCQHCRHRCKSSVDLLNHLKQCTEASRCGNDSFDSLSGESNGGRAGCADSIADQHPMENRVFIWNKIPGGEPGQREGSQCSDSRGQANNTMESSGSSGHGASSATCEENSYYGVETAPGYGEVTKKMTPEEEAANSSLKKVYKCPHCSFWASTASRFHVHIVGHLNKKPFECSLCSYRSNWRWDITKHIRLKTIRDPSHKNARVLMNDETGRRNYTKYNKYITLMKVTEEDGDPKLMKSGEMTPNQVASLSFINDFNKGVVSNALTSTHLNGIKEDITLEPIPSKSSNGGGGNNGSDQLNDSFIHIPLLATMMNVAMTQQQHQQQKDADQGQTTMITPSVTISAVKRSPPPLMKPSDDLVTDVRQEGNEKKTFYRCRKCSFRHTNRDAVLAHVKIHYQDANYPIVTATATTSPKLLNSQQQQPNTPLQVAVNQNIYMNKVLAAMCLSQQQQQQQPNSSTPNNNNNNDQQHSIISTGLLQQAIQGASPNSPLGCLALSLAGKSPAKATASILEHGEQKATQNEASAQRPTSPKQHNNNNPNNISIANFATSSSTTASPNSSGGSNAIGGVGMVGSTSTSASSLQHLLTSPRGTYTTSSSNSSLRNPVHSPTIGNSINNSNGGSGHTNNNNNNKNLVMGALTVLKHNIATTPSRHSNDGVFGSPTSAVSTAAAAAATATDVNATSSSSSLLLASPNGAGSAAQHNTPSGTTRHCRLKHAGDIRIETLDRTVNSNERNAPPVYRPLGSGATNESNYGQTLKALQQQQQQHMQQQQQQHQQQSTHLHNMSGPPSNSVLMSNNKNEQHLLHSPLAGTAAANAATTPQELQQAAAAYIAATYKAAAAAANSAGNSSAAAAVAAAAALGLSSEDLLLHQQLQQNDQIEITRLPQGVGSAAAGQSQSSVQQPQPQQQQLNSKCKQQKCPMCPYISESKSQMNYHISLHKPTQYECKLCTFVCAKKQHLSSHMRTVHQQHNLGASNQMSSSINAAINSMDFSMALQLAAVAQAQQDPSSLNSPLAIDLTALKQKFSVFHQEHQQQQQRQSQQAAAQHTQQQLQHAHLHAPTSVENRIKCILYCPKCPARYIEKYAETSSAKSELEDHLKYHSGSDALSRMANSKPTTAPAFKCEFCDYAGAHEVYIQKHRYVHTQSYQDKCAELYKHVHEDAEYAPPKLMQITLAKSLQQAPETIWIVDNDLNEQCKEQHQQQQHASISSSSVTPGIASATMAATAHFDTANSLLKKQLESGMGGSSAGGAGSSAAMGHSPPPTPMPKELPNADADDSSNMPSTSASVATSDLAVDGGSDFTSSIASPAAMEKCLYCPYETKHTTFYKAHLQHHICISQQKEAYTCEHCDYTDAKQEHIEEHTRVHFNAVEKLKSVAFFTSYDNLELSVEQEQGGGGADDEATAATSEELMEEREQQAEDPSEPQESMQNEVLLNIKQEHNNNNEEHVINENVLKEQQLTAVKGSSSGGLKIKVDSDDRSAEKTPTAATTTTAAATDNMKKPCNKIILYKNDGCLSIKREGANSTINGSNNNNNSNANCENISDRLRRRISRNNSSNATHLNGNANNNNNNNNNNISDEQSAAVAVATGCGAQQPSHKTILVNAKTGQVISRN